MASKNILILPGDGIGPEIVKEGIRVLNAVSKKYSHDFYLTYAPFGAETYDEHKTCFPDSTKAQVKDTERFHGILKGPVGLDKAGSEKLRAKGVKVENETVIALRSPEFLNSYACYRPVILPREFAFFSPLRPEIVGDGIDILMMRELVGDLYFGKKIEGKETGMQYATDDCTYTRGQVERFADLCFKEAQQRGVKLTNIHKANVKATGRFWKAIFDEVGKQYPNVPTEECLVDSFATFLNTRPTDFNGVVALSNMEGDIITDQAGGVIGSLGLMPSACWNPMTRRGYFEASHGAANSLKGKNQANPYSMIGSVAFMLDMALGMKEESADVWKSMNNVFGQGYMTGELVRKLTKVQHESRADDDLRRLLLAFDTLQPGIDIEEVHDLIMRSNKRYDESLEARVVSTAEFGNLVVKNILGEAV
jgi:3-isopropylmalate dehydrogenase